MISAMAAVPIAIGVGASIDLVDSYRQKERLQAATDAAALAGARTIMKGGSKDTAEAAARAYLSANLGTLSAGYAIESIQVDVTKGTVRLQTKTFDRVQFAGLLGKQQVELRANALVKGAGTSLEIALVLDNSGSMDTGTRIEDLRAAATSFVTVMDADAYAREKVSISIVPFSSAVNVGTNNANAEWIDKGTAPIHAEWLNTRGDSSAPAAKRQTIRALLKSAWAWNGCVETRERGSQNLDITDVAPSTGDPKTLFTPMFAPDEPDTLISGENYRNNYLRDDRPTSSERLNDCTKSSGSGSNTKWACKVETCSASSGVLSCSNTSSRSRTVTASTNPGNNGGTTTYLNLQCATSIANNNTLRGQQDRTCKYKGGGWPTNISTAENGPSYMCDSAPILPLTKLSTGKTTLTSKIAGLQPLGGTNILEGFMWGWRSLSAAAPFTEGRVDGTSDNRKILVVMTDGQNTLYDTRSGETLNMTQYSTYGMGSTGRLMTPTAHYLPNQDWEHKQMMAALDGRMAQACTNAKNAGYIVYTVILTSGSDIDWTAPKKLMSDCASSTDRAYAPASSAELKPVFESIAKSIRRIHLAE